MGGCASKPKDLKEEGEAPVTSDEPSSAKAAGVKEEVVNEGAAGGAQSLGFLLREEEAREAEQPEAEEKAEEEEEEEEEPKPVLMTPIADEEPPVPPNAEAQITGEMEEIGVPVAVVTAATEV